MVVKYLLPLAFGKFYGRKHAIVEPTLNYESLPSFERYAVPLLRVLTDCGSQYCGNRETQG